MLFYYPKGESVEWKKNLAQKEFDGANLIGIESNLEYKFLI